MKYFGLIWRNIWRKKIRTSLTMLSVMVAFLLFALLSAIGYAFRSGEDVADAERLIVIDKISLINPLPLAYKNRIAATEGVDVIWIGQFDLTNFLGIPGEFENPVYLDACEEIAAAARRQGKALGAMAPNPAWAADYKRKGFEMIAAGPDQAALMAGVANILEGAK